MTPPRKKQRLSLDAAEVKAAVENATEAAVESNAVTKDASKESELEAAAQRRSLFVRSLPDSATSESLTDIFSASFPIKHAVAVTDKESKKCKGYGFVTFADAEDCQKAKEEFNGFAVDGKKLRCEVAEPRHREKGAAAVPSAGEKFKESQAKERAAAQVPRLIVRNLPWSIKYPDQLAKLFQSYGKVKHTVLPKGKTGLLRGFGFVIMRGRPNAEKAIEGVNGKEIDGRQLAVDWAVDKETWDNTPQEETKEKETANGDATDEDAVDGASEHIMDEDDDESGSDEDDEDVDMDDMDDEDEDMKPRTEDNSSTLFIRNLPFSCTDEDLEDHFTQFGSVRYARIVVDQETERPRGTGFVCFYELDDADNVIKNAPRHQPPRLNDPKAKDGSIQMTHSVLQNEDADPTGKFTLDGRVLQISRAVNKNEANRLTEEGAANRFKRDTDRRRLYLLSEGTIPSNSPLYEQLPPSERTMREASAKQRKTLIESNPSLHLSLTRLSVRNIPRSITSKDLKQLAREAVVGFATDVKEGKRGRLNREELSRGGEEDAKAEADRKKRAKGIVKQAKIVFEGREGAKVDEKSGAGRSRGYGFIEYYTHRSALMGLRWLNGHAIGYQAQEQKGKGKMSQEMLAERKKRLIVEFAIENAQVVKRRKEIEEKSRERSFAATAPTADGKRPSSGRDTKFGAGDRGKGGKFDRKRKRDGKDEAPVDEEKNKKAPADEKLAKRQQIIQKKRMARRARKQGA
ncbi:RNA-binding domain-containing protein [Aureobasidium pullulans]|uniref:RNA-binding domain-containing protein n=1 Tax=Aureobasidium pullulans TaxID=5580 RepID=A0A4V6TF52_AURPU|nr:RNA-binding domain-containing protein [Aureobasidium pullulans]